VLAQATDHLDSFTTVHIFKGISHVLQVEQMMVHPLLFKLGTGSAGHGFQAWGGDCNNPTINITTCCIHVARSSTMTVAVLLTQKAFRVYIVSHSEVVLGLTGFEQHKRAGEGTPHGGWGCSWGCLLASCLPCRHHQEQAAD